MKAYWLANNTSDDATDPLRTEMARILAVENLDVEKQHERLCCEWIHRPNAEWINNECNWHIAEGHPMQGSYYGRTFYTEYVSRISSAFYRWEQQITEVIGTSIGAIVVGIYRFQEEENKSLYWAPFVHFYRIHQRELTSVRYYMGTINFCSL